MTINESDRQKKIFELCEQALNYTSAERDAFLHSACTGDESLKAAVKSLLHAVNESTDFLNHADSHNEHEPGDFVGAYKIVSKLGMGGMGGVYLAERDAAGFAQRVALKILRTHLHSTEMNARFDEERRILARLNHPYIARLIDGGTTENGLPYLVMELIEGVPIDEFCDAHCLSVNARLQLMQKVALAIQSAHQNLVVHSDLKPSNILVTEDGIPKLLDFGIATLLRQVPKKTQSEKIRTEIIALTPDYASPEQIDGEAVTTASDIYSLGVLTYKLLVGETPYEVGSVSRDKLATTLKNVTIARPSTRVLSVKNSAEMTAVAKQRGTNPLHLARYLAGDIDAILAKALAKNPNDRYVSSSAFADDLMRCGKKLPITARDDTHRYRATKFISRNRVSVGAGSVAILALIAGLGMSLWQAHVARQRFDDLHGFTEAMIFELHDEISTLPGATQARELLTRESLHYLDRLASDAKGNQKLQLDLSMAYKRMGDVSGNPNNANLGNVDSALDSYRKSLEIAENLSEGAGERLTIERHKAVVLEKIADVLAWQHEMDSALEYSGRSLSLFQQLAKEQPENDKAVLSVAISHVKRGDLLGHPDFPNAAKPEQSILQYQKALATIDPIVRTQNGPAGAVRYLALIHERVGTMFSEQGDYSTALAHFNTSLKIRERLATLSSAHADNRRDVAIAFEKIADVQVALGEARVSLDFYGKALEIYRALAKSDPTNTNALRTLAIGLENMGDALVVANDRDQAIVHYNETVKIRRDLVARNPDNERLKTELDELAERLTKY